MTGRLALALTLCLYAGDILSAEPGTLQPLQQQPANAFEDAGFERIGDAQSVPDGVVTALAEDSRGFIWIGTPAGLVRYDGYRYRVHQREAGNPTSLTGNFIRALLATQDGRLWVGTETDGVSVYDPNRESFRSFRHDPEHAASLPAGSIRALAEDLDGQVWIGSTGGGLSRWSPTTDTLDLISVGKAWAPPIDTRIQSLRVDHAGDLWVGSWNGLLRIARGGDAVEVPSFRTGTASMLDGEVVTRLFEDAGHGLWIGTRSGRLLRIDAARSRIESLAIDAASANRGPSDIHDFAQSHPDWVWIAGEGGIEWRSVADGGLLHRLRHEPSRPSSLPSNQVRALLHDRAGWIWSGSYGGGVLRHSPPNAAFRVRRGEPAPDSVFAEPNVRSVAQLSTGEVWVGTQERGVAIFDAQWQLTGSVSLTREAFGTERQQIVSAITEAANGSVWVAADGLLYRRGPGDASMRLQADVKLRVRRMVAAKDGTLWVATADGLFRLAEGDPQPRRLGLEKDEALGGDINAIGEAEDGGLWVGGASGLYRLDAGKPTLRRIVGAQDEGLAHETVLGLLVGRAGTLWVDTPAGLHRLIEETADGARFDRISERLGIGGRPFGANLMQDGQGRLWTQQHVYDPRQETIYPLGRVDGVDIGTGWFRSYAQMHDGRMLFGGSRGLLIVTPDKFEPARYQPPMALTELRVDGNRRALADPEGGLVLAPGERSFSVEFAALDFSAPQQLNYAFKLEGDRDRWIDTDSGARFASYSNLAPGRYLLRVRGSNRHGEWSPHELALPVTVLPLWWQTWWFRLLAATAGLAAIAGFVRLRTANLRRRRTELEAEVARRTAELLAVSEDLASKSHELEEASLTDPLTGLRNRRYLTQHIDADVALAIRQHEPPSRTGRVRPGDADLVFFMIDIDHFKQVNDIHGHSAGDAVLVEMRRRLDQVFRRSDHLVRWGGEEFLVVNRAASRENAAELAERARLAVAGAPFLLDDGAALDKTCSIGFCCFPVWPDQPRAVSWATAIDLADSALYAAKRAGRNGWVGIREGRVAPTKPDELPTQFSLLPGLCNDQLSLLSSFPRDTVLAALTAQAAKGTTE